MAATMIKSAGSLLVGIDLNDRFTQISCYNARRNEIDSICPSGRPGADEIPTCLAYHTGNETWVFGEEARTLTDFPWIMISGFLQDYDTQEQMEIRGQTFEKKELLKIWFSKILDLLNQYYQRTRVACLTVTGRNLSQKLMADITSICEELGLSAASIRFLPHKTCFINYALCQPAELWNQDVGMFEYDTDGLVYYHLTLYRKRVPMVASVETMPLSAYMKAEDIGRLTDEELDTRFSEVIREVLGGRQVCAVYLVGHGFAGDWMERSLRLLCTHRRGFIGSNLYARGAAYNSMMEDGQRKNRDFIALSDEMVPVGLYLEVFAGGRVQRCDLVNAGTDWYNIAETVQVILDETDTVVIHAADFITNKEKLIPFRMEDLPDRPRRTTRVRISLTFETDRICLISMQDLGFGSFFASSGKVWKKRLNVAEYDGPSDFRQSGRLLLDRLQGEGVPYFFNVSGVRVFTVEELCYYLYDNVYAVKPDTFGQDLLYWLETDMQEPDLARGISNAMRSGDVRHAVRYLLTQTGYYDQSEISSLMRTMDGIARQNPTENMKIEGDNCVQYGRYMEAIAFYQNVIYDMEHDAADEVSSAFKSNTWYNLGVTYARLLNYRQAQRAFKRAWEISPDETSLHAYLWVSRLLIDETAFFDGASQAGLSEAEAEAIGADYDEAMRKAGQAAEAALPECSSLDVMDQPRYRAWVRTQVDDLKRLYRADV